MKKTIAALLIGLGFFTSKAQTAIQNFTLLNVADSKMISLDSYPTCSGLVILFTGNNCPYDNYYTARVKSLISAYQGKIQFILVNSYLEPEETIEKMKEKYTALGLSVPNLAYKEQLVMDSLGAKKRPEAF